MDKHPFKQGNKDKELKKETLSRAQLLHPYGDRQIPECLTRLPLPTEPLIGREEKLLELQEKVQHHRIVSVVSGIEGVGKTSLVAQYVQESLTKWKHILWLDLSDSFSWGLQTNASLAPCLGIQLKGKAASDVQEIVKALAALQGPCLLVVHQADDELIPYLEHLPEENWKVLMTTWKPLEGIATCHLDLLPQKAAVALFRAHYSLDADTEQIKKIVHWAQGHPLTIKWLAKTAQHLAEADLGSFIQLLAKKGLPMEEAVNLTEVDHYQERALDQLLPHLEAIYSLLDFTAIETRLLKYFLTLPVEIHDWPFLERALGLQEEEDIKAYQQGLQNLVKLGLVNTYQTGFQIHSMIQQVLEQQLTVNWSDVEPWAYWLTTQLYIDAESSTGDPASRFSWIPYGERFMEIDIQAVDAAAMSILQSNLGMAYQSLYYYNEALYLLEQALNSDLETYELGHPKVAIRQSNLGHLYKELAYQDKGKKLFEEAHAALQDHYGPDHPKVAISSVNLAGSYQDEGDFAAAQALLEKALAIDLAHFGPKHTRTARSYANLGALLWDREQKEAALSHFQTAYGVFKEKLGADHPNTQVLQRWLDSIR